jgi:hypothetical protein
MLTEYGPKRGDVIGRIVFQIFLVGILLYCLYAAFFIKFSYLIKQPVYIRAGLVAILFFMNVKFFLELYFLPFWVIVDDELKTLEIKYLMRPSKVLGVLDIISYSSTTIKIGTRSGTSNYSGIILSLSQERKVLLSEYNLYEYVPIEIFLMDLKIKNTGEESFSFLTYYRHQ